MFNKLIGVLVIAFGLALIFGGIWAGIWWCLVLGIVDIIDQIKAEQTDAFVIALAIVRIIFFELPIVVGVWAGVFVTGFGSMIMFANKLKVTNKRTGIKYRLDQLNERN